jgi:hypothetical protein
VSWEASSPEIIDRGSEGAVFPGTTPDRAAPRS